MYFPSIEHLIKCISNNFFDLAKKDSSLCGRGLLEATRIKAICNDINNHVCELHNMCERLYQQEEEFKISHAEVEIMLAEMKEQTLSAINAIIPCHCGDHTT